MDPNLKFLNLPKIVTEVQSPETRGQGTYALYFWAQKEPEIHSVALQIFRTCLETEQDSWTTLNSLRGIEHIAGAEEAKIVRLALLNRSRPDVIASVVLTIKDAWYAPALIDLLSRRSEKNIRVAIIRTLGRLKDGSALTSILGCLNDPELRPNAVEALSDLRDPRAIPYLEPLQNDRTEAWEVDNHGPMLRVCDLAKDALEHLRGTATPTTLAGNFGISSISNLPAMPRWNTHAQPGPSIQAPPAGFIPPMNLPPPLAALPTWRRLVPLIPLFAALFEIAWIVLIVITQLYRGTLSSDDSLIHELDAIAVVPALVGLLSGALVIRWRWIDRPWQWVILAVGCLACGMFAFSFSWEFFH